MAKAVSSCILPLSRFLISWDRVSTVSTWLATSTTASLSSARTNSLSASKPASSQARPPWRSISLSQPQAMQSSISSATLPKGLK
ncbi:hypothetical protein D3C78_1588340 [compost metagenome]